MFVFFELQIYCFYSDLKTFDPQFLKKIFSIVLYLNRMTIKCTCFKSNWD
jgi:hypothetical protein